MGSQWGAANLQGPGSRLRALAHSISINKSTNIMICQVTPLTKKGMGSLYGTKMTTDSAMHLRQHNLMQTTF